MPNIIEQQDLLKGLPDNRLAMLLQNPVADIPPFLVAAEAQRRQAIRQQFQASAPQESVVDSLTKQLANVPQNIQAPAQQPPRMPQMAQTPQAQGVMALQQQPQQQQAQPQQMRMGGMVQRYQTGGTVAPVNKVAPIWNLPQMDYWVPKFEDWASSTLGGMYESATTPYNEKPDDMSIPDVDLSKINIEDQYKVDFKPTLDKTRESTSKENQDKDQGPRSETAKVDKFRAQLEELYASQEPSDWEKAQRWFAMAEQFFDPSKTMGESVAGAGRAFAEMTGEQARAQRDAELQGKKSLLEYDIAKAGEEEDRAIRAQERADAELKARTEVATGELAGLRRQMGDIADDIRRTEEAAIAAGGITPEIQRKIDALSEMYNNIGNRIASYENFLSRQYSFPGLEQADLKSGKITPPRI